MNPLDYILRGAKTILEGGKNAITSLFTPKPVSKPMEFKVGEGMTGQEKIKAQTTPLTTPIKPLVSPTITAIKSVPPMLKAVSETPVGQAIKSQIGFGGVFTLPGNVQKITTPILESVSQIPEVKSALVNLNERTSGTGIVAAIQAAGPDKTFKQAYDSLKAYQAGDQSKFNQFLYQLGDSAPQTALGVALNFIPIAGKPLSTAYWTGLSASEQIQNDGKVSSIDKIILDVAGDKILGNSLESLFKKPTKTLFQTIKKSFISEGGTEVAQDLGKYAIDYRDAKTPEEKKAVIEKAKEYFTSGQILTTFGVGGISGAGVGTGSYIINQGVEQYKEMTPGERQAGFAKVPFIKDTPPSPKGDSITELQNYKKSTDDNIRRLATDLEGDLMSKVPVEARVKASGDMVELIKREINKSKGILSVPPGVKEVTSKIDDNIAMSIDEKIEQANLLNKKGQLNLDLIQDLEDIKEKVLTNKMTAEDRLTYNESVRKLGQQPLFKLRSNQTEAIGSDRMNDVVARERFDIPNLEKISFGGSDRDVYDLGNNRVLKVAKTARGLAQNGSEGEIYAPVPKVIETGKNYVIVEKAEKPNAKTKELVKKLEEFKSFRLGGRVENDAIDMINKTAEYYFNKGDEEMGSMVQDLNNYTVMINDLTAIRNWGTIDGEPVLLDAGTLNNSILDEYKGTKNLDNPEYREIYNKSKQAKKQFGDTDKKTAYKIGDNIVFDRTKQELQTSLNKIFGKDVPLQTIVDPEMMSNPKALGEVSDGIIKLLEENGSLSEVVANHEGWHWFKRSLSKEKRTQLTQLENEFAMLPENKAKVDKLIKDGYTKDEVAEELMADHFAEYTKTGKTFSEKARLFFSRLWETLKNLFNKKGEVLREFRNVKQSLATQARPTMTKLQPAYKQTPENLILLKEAKKYNSAEEFVNKLKGNKYTEMFHGTDDAGYKALSKDITKYDRKLLGKNTGQGDYFASGISFTSDINTAKSYGKNVIPAYYNYMDSNILSINAGDFGKLLKKYNIDEYDNNASELLTKSLKKDGYHGISVFDGIRGQFETTIIDPSIILTKSQLTDIWNKANDTKYKQISPLDRLIAQGKIKIKSKDGRDVYEYKKGNQWFTARDEDSAIKQATGVTTPKPTPVLPKELENKLMGLEIRKEAIDNSPLNFKKVVVVDKKGKKRAINPLASIMNIKEGTIKELGDTTGKVSTRVEDLMGKAGYEDPTKFKEDLERFVEAKKAIAEDEKILKEQIAMEKGKQIAKQEVTPVAKKDIPQFEGEQGEVKSLELLAKAQEAIKSGDIDSGSLKSIISKTVTPVQNKVNIIDTFFRTPDRVMKTIGFDKEARDLRNSMDAYWKELPKNIEKINNWRESLPKESNERVFKFLDGQPITLNAEEQKVADEIRVYLKDWARRLGLKQENQITDYITRIFEKDAQGEFSEELAKMIADKIPGSVYNPFLLKRLGAKGYKQDTWLALSAYTKRATRKVHMDPVLEEIQARTGSSLELSNIEKSQFEYIKKYISNINLRPTDLDESIDNLIKKVSKGKSGQRSVTRATRILRQMTYRGMLGLNPGSALRNLSQGVNTYATLGEKYTTIGYINLFKKGAMDELKNEGVLNAGFIQDKVLSATGKKIEQLDKALFVFFDAAEKINRGSAYFGAKSKALAEGKTEEQAVEYAKSIVRKTQFVFDVIDTPVGLSSDIMKTMFQFQTFTTKQIEFLTEMLKDKNVLGLMRYALAGLAFVFTLGKAFNMEPKELIPWYRFQVPPSMKGPLEITKAVFNAPDKYGQQRDISQKASDVGKSLIGYFPAGTQIKKTVEGIGAVKEGAVYDKAGKLQYEQGQSSAEKIQSILFGKYAQKNAQEYFDRVETNSKEKAKMMPTYEAIQKMNDADAQEALDSMTDEEYETYKSIRTAEKAKKTIKDKAAMLPRYKEIEKMSDEEAQKVLDAMTDEEYETYKKVKKDQEELKKASEGEKPEFGAEESEQNIIKTVWAYAKAIGTDPVTAFNRIFTGQKIRYVTNGVVVVERLPLSESQKIKAEQGGDNPTMKLDHTIPLQLGGSNSVDNLKLVPTDEWATYTPVENAIGIAIRNNKISKKEAQTLIKDFKDGKITSEDVYLKLK